MNDSRGVRFGKSIRNLVGELEKLLVRQRLSAKHLSERLSLYVLHGDVASTFMFADVVNSDDVRVVERGSCVGFLLETPQAFRIQGKILSQDFDGHIPAELEVLSSIDLSHSAGTNARHNFVRAESCSCF